MTTSLVLNCMSRGLVYQHRLFRSCLLTTKMCSVAFVLFLVVLASAIEKELFSSTPCLSLLGKRKDFSRFLFGFVFVVKFAGITTPTAICLFIPRCVIVLRWRKLILANSVFHDANETSLLTVNIFNYSSCDGILGGLLCVL